MAASPNDSNETTDICAMSDQSLLMGQNLSFAAYHVITIVYLILGVSGRLITLFAIYKETSKDGAYLYQIFVLIVEILEICTFSFFVFVLYWFSGFFEPPGAVWFRRCYACMWFTGYLSSPVQKTFNTCTLLLTLAMTCDRICCLAKPHGYGLLPHKKIQWTSFVFCITIGMVTSVPFGMMLEVDEGRAGVYSLTISRFHGWQFQYVWTQVHIVFKIACTSLLFLSNFILYAVHRKRMKERAKVQKKNEEANRSSMTLFKMALCQSTLNTLGQSALVSYHISEYQVEHFLECYGLIFGASVDVVMQMADIVEFYLLLAISRSFRRMVAKTMKDIWQKMGCRKNRIEDTGNSSQDVGSGSRRGTMSHRHD